MEIKQRQVIIGNCFTRSRLHLVISLGVHRVRPKTYQPDPPPYYPAPLSSVTHAIETSQKLYTTTTTNQTFTQLKQKKKFRPAESRRRDWVSDSLRARRLTELEAHETGHCYTLLLRYWLLPRLVRLHRLYFFFKFPSTHFFIFS